jgi:hypothetical protein
MSTGDGSQEPNVQSAPTTLPIQLPPVVEAEFVHPIVTQKDEQIAELQERLAEKTDKHNETKFWLTAVIVILGDCLLLPDQPFLMQTALIILEFLAGVHFAKKLGLEKVVVLLDSLHKRWIELFKK